MSYYKNQIVRNVIPSETLTASFDDNTVITDARAFNVITVYVEYTPALNTSECYIQIEAGSDDANLFPKVALIDEDLSGTSTAKSHIYKLEAVSADVAVKKRFLLETADIKMRISAKEITSGAFGTINIIIIKNEQ